MKKQTKLSQQPKWNYSPFNKAVIQSKTKSILSKNDNEIIYSSKLTDNTDNLQGIVRLKTVDNEKYVKLYTAQLSLWFSLTVPAQKTLSYIMINLHKNQDVVYINLKDILAFTQYSSPVSIYEGLNELVNMQIIARTKEASYYFINPSYIFNGDRVVFVEAIQRSQQAIAERIESTYRSVQPQFLADDIDGVSLESHEGALLQRHTTPS